MSSKLVGFVLLPFYTTHLTVLDYGMLGLLEVTSQAFITIVGLRLYTAFFRWYWDKEYINHQRSLFFTTIIILSALSFIFFLGISQISTTISKLLFDSPIYNNLIKFMALSAVLQIIIQMPLTLMRLQEKAVSYSVFNTLKIIITLILTIYFIAYQNMKIEGIYLAQIIGQISFLLVISPYLLKNIHLKLEVKIFKGMLIYSYPLVLSALAGIFLSIADRYFLKLIGTLSDVGVYSLGYKIANTIQVFIVTSIQLAITPMMFKLMNDPNSKKFYSKILTYLSFIVMFCILLVSLFSYELITILARNENYWPAYQIVPVLSMGIFFGMLRYQTQIGLSLVKKTSVISIITILVSALNIVLNLILIPKFLIIGAAVASMISQLVFWVMIQRSAQKSYYIPYENRKILLVIVTGLVLLGLGYAVQPLTWSIRFFLKIIFVGSFPLILYVLNFYEKIELIKLKEFLLKSVKESSK